MNGKFCGILSDHQLYYLRWPSVGKTFGKYDAFFYLIIIACFFFFVFFFVFFFAFEYKYTGPSAQSIISLIAIIFICIFYTKYCHFL